MCPGIEFAPAVAPRGGAGYQVIKLGVAGFGGGHDAYSPCLYAISIRQSDGGVDGTEKLFLSWKDRAGVIGPGTKLLGTGHSQCAELELCIVALM